MSAVRGEGEGGDDDDEHANLLARLDLSVAGGGGRELCRVVG